MELRHLRYFVAIGEEQHYGRAARRLRVAQPALSRQIQDLEEELGFKLFERLPRGVKLSAAGKLFLEDARRILQEVNEVIVLEEIEDAFIFKKPGDEVEVGLAILDAVLACLVGSGETVRIVREPAIAKYLLHDVRHRHVLENAAIVEQREEPGPGNHHGAIRRNLRRASLLLRCG